MNSAFLFICSATLQCFAAIGRHRRLKQTTISSLEYSVVKTKVYRSTTMATFPPWILHDTDVKPPKTK